MTNQLFKALLAQQFRANPRYQLVLFDRLPIEQQVAKAVEADRITVVHFWAPWCSN